MYVGTISVMLGLASLLWGGGMGYDASSEAKDLTEKRMEYEARAQQREHERRMAMDTMLAEHGVPPDPENVTKDAGPHQGLNERTMPISKQQIEEAILKYQHADTANKDAIARLKAAEEHLGACKRQTADAKEVMAHAAQELDEAIIGHPRDFRHNDRFNPLAPPPDSNSDT